jgi:ribosomal protein S18 acetylase RimI-like enzyme
VAQHCLLIFLVVPQLLQLTIYSFHTGKAKKLLPTEGAALDLISTAIEDNLCAYAAFFGATPVAEFSNQSSLLWVISRIPTLPFTGILRPYPPAATLADTIETTMAYFQQQHARPSWIFNPARNPPDFIAHLNYYQLKQTATLPGMALKLSGLQPVAPHPLRVTCVADLAMLATWVSIYAESNGAPDWIGAELVSLFSATDYRSAQPLALYLGWQADQPVASAASFRVAGVVGLYEVATLPAFRQQGIASTMTYHVLEEARQHGYTLATLVSSLIAEQMYRKLGFEEFCRLVIYN